MSNDITFCRFFRRVGIHIKIDTLFSENKGTNFLIKVPNNFENIFHEHCPQIKTDDVCGL
jgi:hypothetical protein